MKIYALSDLHVGLPDNRDTVARLPSHPDDWLILAGDLGETTEHLAWVLQTVRSGYDQVIWVPGNHELWTSGRPQRSGVAKYEALLEVCRRYDVITPEDDWPRVPGTDLILAPMFLLYDYTFAPEGMAVDEVVAWAAASGIVCADERRLLPDPFESRQAWCADRLRRTAARLDAIDADLGTILVNHWPLRLDLCRLFRIPRFTPWCGTRHTEDWHTTYRAKLVVSGHLHMRATDWRDGVRFEEVSLGYPRQYDRSRGAAGYLRQVWPPTRPAPQRDAGPEWHR